MYGIYWDENDERQAGVLHTTVFRENPPQREGVTYFLTDHIAGTAGYFNCASDPTEVVRTPQYVGDNVAGLTLPELMVALDFWRWVKKMGPGDAEPRVPEYTMLDGTVHYDIYVFDLSAEPYDDNDRKLKSRYIAEAKTIERRK